ncbi:uncharacterized protein LOC127436066 [Myxocyprinus asiaticus]|uniref:uncharacterized protein LOC127436066 n=1 Tax=Myxocyprinus asiaticus TaxID=70543 RepID=UPI002222E1C7|nr:uncharacterized protein LOC127436066 [Myxocyprinus asiaticus]
MIYSSGCKMKLTRTKPNWILTLILTFHIMSVQLEGFHKSDLRVLIVGGKSSAQLSVVNTLQGREDCRQEDRQIIKYVIIENEGRVMMLIAGPNLCEKNPVSQDFKTALTLASPGPHAVLITLSQEDLQSEQCDLLQQVQELLGVQILQYCIVLLLQNDPQKPDRNTERVGEIIDACRGRFHIITDSEPKPAQTTALLEEIHKLVWLNGETFYSTMTQQLETERLELLERLREIESILYKEEEKKETQFSSVIYYTLGGTVGIVAWIFIISMNAVVTGTEDRQIMLIFARLGLAVVFMVTLRNALSPNIAVPINLSRASAFTAVVIQKKESALRRKKQRDIDGEIFFILSLGLILGTITSVWSWSDVLVACCASPGVAFSVLAFLKYSFTFNQMNDGETLMFALKLFFCCTVGATLSMWCVTVFTLIGVKMTIILLILVVIILCFCFKHETHIFLFVLFIVIIWTCCCVLVGSIILILKHSFHVLYNITV